MAFGGVLADLRLKLQAREELQKLAENAGYSIHGGDSLSIELSFLLEPEPTYQSGHPAVPLHLSRVVES